MELGSEITYFEPITMRLLGSNPSQKTWSLYVSEGKAIFLFRSLFLAMAIVVFRLFLRYSPFIRQIIFFLVFFLGRKTFGRVDYYEKNSNNNGMILIIMLRGGG